MAIMPCIQYNVDNSDLELILGKWSFLP